MISYLKQSTASQSRTIGPFVDDTDFKTAETGLTIANTDIKLIINGAASANKNSGGGTHRANGIYSITFDATDTATVGEVMVSVVVAGALPVFNKFFVLEEAVYDAMFGASALGYVANAPVNVAQISGDSAAADNLETMLDGTGGGTLSLGKLNIVASGANVALNVYSPTGNAVYIEGGSEAVWIESTGAVGLEIIGAQQGVFIAGDNGLAAVELDGHMAITAKSTSASPGVRIQTMAAGLDAVTVLDSAGARGTIDTNIDGTLTSLTNAPTAGDLTATMKASVNAEVLDVLNTDTFAEPGQGTPAATTSLAAKINYLYKAWRNKKTQTASVFSLFADDATTVDQKASVSDDGTTTTVGEIATGP